MNDGCKPAWIGRLTIFHGKLYPRLYPRFALDTPLFPLLKIGIFRSEALLLVGAGRFACLAQQVVEQAVVAVTVLAGVNK